MGVTATRAVAGVVFRCVPRACRSSTDGGSFGDLKLSLSTPWIGDSRASLKLAKQLMRPLAILVFFARAWVPAEATTLQQLSLGEMAEKATSIVRARVTGSRAVVRGADVYTLYRFEALETLKPGSAVSEVAVPGGVAGGIRQVVAGAPALRAGQEYVLFLWTGRSGLTQLLGLSQGVFMVEHTASGDLRASRAAAGEQMLDAAGHAAQDQAVSMAWAEMRAKVTSMAAGRR